MMRHHLRLAATLAAVAITALPLAAQSATASRTDGALTPAQRDSAARKEQLSYRREVFAYEPGGRRDPFVSLATTGVLRPTIGGNRSGKSGFLRPKQGQFPPIVGMTALGLGNLG